VGGGKLTGKKTPLRKGLLGKSGKRAGHLLPWLAIAFYGMCCMSAIVVVVRKRQAISSAPAFPFPLAVT